MLGFEQTATENAKVCSQFLLRLLERGLSYQQGLLFVIDGGKGLRKAIEDVFGDYAAVQRCQWHKRENVVAYLAHPTQAAVKSPFSYLRARYFRSARPVLAIPFRRDD